jgi:hypothetical protein
MVHLTTKVKRQLKHRGSSEPNQLLGSLSPWKPNWKANVGSA